MEISIKSILNIIAEGPRFFDLEKLVLDTDREMISYAYSRQSSMDLKRLFCNEEGWGKPWPESEP